MLLTPAATHLARIVTGLLCLGLVSAPHHAASGATSAPAVAERITDDPPRAKIPGRGDDFARLPERCYEQGTGRYFVLSPCRITTFKKRPWVVAWGDSHMLQYYPALRRLAQEHRVNLVALHAAGCPVSKTFPASSGEGRIYCDATNEKSFAYIKRLDRTAARVHVVIAGYFSGYRSNYAIMRRAKAEGRASGLTPYVEHMAKLAVERTRPMAVQLAKLNRPVTFVAQAATIPADARPCLLGEDPYQCDLRRSRALPDEEGNRRFMARNLVAPIPKAEVITPSELYCGPLLCRAHVDRVNTFWDPYHLGARLAARTKPWFRPIFKQATRP